MSEYIILYQATGALLGVVLASFLYSLGGRAGKWKRRFVASFVLAATVNVLCVLRGVWQPLMLAIWPILIGGFSLGYGADVLWLKVVRRLIYASAVLMAGVLMAFILGGNAWWVLIPHIGVGLFSVFLGVKNILPAALEEIMVCVLLNLFLITYPFV